MFRHNLNNLLLEKSRKEKRRITQKELAKETGIAESTISHWANKEYLTSVEASTVKAFLRYFGKKRMQDLIILVDEDDSIPNDWLSPAPMFDPACNW